MDPLEQAGYIEVSGTHLYTVLHGVADPVARVLLVGPFASERHSSYTPWVRWARFLAARRIEALRYDYRGIGESTGVFEDMSFDNWSEDVEFLAGWLQSRLPDVPLILHGLELGALLASKVFAAGVANALLLWSAPANAQEVLRPALLRRIAVDNMFKYRDGRKPVADYVRQLEIEPLEVDGYQWSSRLWRDSFKFETPLGEGGEAGAAWAGGRPVRVLTLDKSAAPLVKGSTYESINPDLKELFADNFEWIANVLTASQTAGAE
jgi:alpha/beta superfamily hydrolase